jgi:hypothetical protein
MWKFRITGTGAVVLWRRTAQLYLHGTIRDISLPTRRVLTMLSIKFTNNNNDEIDANDPDKTYSKDFTIHNCYVELLQRSN